MHSFVCCYTGTVALFSYFVVTNRDEFHIPTNIICKICRKFPSPLQHPISAVAFQRHFSQGLSSCLDHCCCLQRVTHGKFRHEGNCRGRCSQFACLVRFGVLARGEPRTIRIFLFASSIFVFITRLRYTYSIFYSNAWLDMPIQPAVSSCSHKCLSHQHSNRGWPGTS